MIILSTNNFDPTGNSLVPYVSSDLVSSSISASYSLVAGSTFNNGTSSIFGTSSWASSASYYKSFPSIKSGQIPSQSFGGTPLIYNVVFTSSYSNANYSVGITGGDARIWTIEQISASNFTICTNSSVLLSQNVSWISTMIGESS